MIDLVNAYVLPAALELLPPALSSQSARAMLLAIGLQETKFLERRQRDNGPARSFWQFEPGELSAFAGVFRHHSTRDKAHDVCRRLRYDWRDVEALRRTTEHNDVLAAAVARLAFWTLPAPLPGPADEGEAWSQYLEAWRPGKPRPETWRANYTEAWERVRLHDSAS